MGLLDKTRRKNADDAAAGERLGDFVQNGVSHRHERKTLREMRGEGERLSALLPEERTTYAVDAFQREVSNGGFEQYLCNSSGALAGELLDALRAVGAERVAEIYRPALAALLTAWLEDEEE